MVALVQVALVQVALVQVALVQVALVQGASVCRIRAGPLNLDLFSFLKHRPKSWPFRRLGRSLDECSPGNGARAT